MTEAEEMVFGQQATVKAFAVLADRFSQLTECFFPRDSLSFPTLPVNLEEPESMADERVPSRFQSLDWNHHQSPSDRGKDTPTSRIEIAHLNDAVDRHQVDRVSNRTFESRPSTGKVQNLERWQMNSQVVEVESLMITFEMLSSDVKKVHQADKSSCHTGREQTKGKSDHSNRNRAWKPLSYYV